MYPLQKSQLVWDVSHLIQRWGPNQKALHLRRAFGSGKNII